MQMDLVPDLTPSGGYQNIVTAMDVFSRSAQPTTNQHAKTAVRVIINIKIKHAYLPKTIISDKRSTFVSQVFKKSRCPRNHPRSCHNCARTNKWHAGEDTHLIEKSAQIRKRRTTIDMAQVCQHCCPKL